MAFLHRFPEFIEVDMKSPKSVQHTFAISMTMPESREQIEHIHVGFLHAFDPALHDSSIRIALGNQVIAGTAQDIPHMLLVLYPRWCPSCLEVRAQRLKTSMGQKWEIFMTEACNIMEMDGQEHEIEWRLRCELAYLEGFSKGRIYALSRPLTGDEATTFVGETLQDFSRNSTFVSLVSSLKNKSREKTLSAGIVGRIQHLTLDDNDLAYEMCLLRKEWEEGLNGFSDGRSLQAAAMERVGVSEWEAVKREQILRNA